MIVGVITLFQDFPTATIVWAIFSIVYQQVENNLIQPQIQKRAVEINPFLVIVSVLFGSALLGVLGALWPCRWPRRSRSACASTWTTEGSGRGPNPTTSPAAAARRAGAGPA